MAEGPHHTGLSDVHYIYIPSPGFYRHHRLIGGIGGDGRQMPVGDRCEPATYQAGIFINRHVEVLKRKGKSTPQGLDEGFLAGPATIKSTFPVRAGQGSQRRLFSGGEKSFDQVTLNRRQGFNVHPDAGGAGDSDQGLVLTMADIEMQRQSRQLRSAVRAFENPKFARVLSQFVCEDTAQRSTRKNKPVARPLQYVPVRALPFLRT